MTTAETTQPAVTATECLNAEIETKRRWEAYSGDALSPLIAATIGVLAKYDPRAAASALLSGQPFGFTREDVELLRTFASDFQSLHEGDAARDLAERIAALLPQESHHAA